MSIELGTPCYQHDSYRPECSDCYHPGEPVRPATVPCTCEDQYGAAGNPCKLHCPDDDPYANAAPAVPDARLVDAARPATPPEGTRGLTEATDYAPATTARICGNCGLPLVQTETEEMCREAQRVGECLEARRKAAAPAVPDAAARLVEERETFQRWALNYCADLGISRNYNGLSYWDARTHFAWGAWQARAALIREAGEMRPAPFPDCNVGTPHECCVARMKRLERERSVASPAVPPKLTAREFYDKNYGFNLETVCDTFSTDEKLRYIYNFAEAYAQHVAAGETRDALVKRCLYCTWNAASNPIGQTYPDLMTMQQSVEHMKVCPNHPMRELEGKLSDAKRETGELREAAEIADDRIRTLSKMLRYIAFVLTGNEESDAQLAADESKTSLAQAESEALKLREAAQKLVDKLKLILPKIDSMCVMEMMHGRKYDGPTLGVELAALQALLAGEKVKP